MTLFRWDGPTGYEVAFSTRVGGVSDGPFESLNLGILTADDPDRVVELHPGELFYVPPLPHDSWVVGQTPYVSLHFLGADRYAR